MANGSDRLLSDSPYAEKRSIPELYDPFGKIIPATNDPAFQPPTDPLKGINPAATAAVIYREVPLTVIQTAWKVSDVRGALSDIVAGRFDGPAQLVDAIAGDDRVQATLGSRTGGLLGRPVRHQVARLPRVKGSDAAKKCQRAWRNVWPRLATEAALSDLQRWSVMLGFGLGQTVWGYDEDNDLNVPYLMPWHPRYTWYHWTIRRFVASTLDGPVAIVPGDGHWVLHAPHGEYRGWMRGAVRAVAQPWLIRNYAYRDAARYSERHGMPIFKAMTPAAGDPNQINAFRQALSTLGQESIIQIPVGVEKGFGYDLEMLEAKADTAKAFFELIDRCESSITLAILYQNLTTEVKEGSYAAARVHGDVRQSALESDERALSHTVYTQLARPFAAMNFGDADLAPITHWQIEPEEDRHAKADTFSKFATAVEQLRRAGKEITNLPDLARYFGIDLQTKDSDPIAGSFGFGK